MADCPDCTTARAQPHWGGYRAACPGCRARSFARSPQFDAARKADKTTLAGRAAREAYRVLLAQVGVEHADVLAWTWDQS